MPGTLWLATAFFLGVFTSSLMGLAPGIVDVRSVASPEGKTEDGEPLVNKPDFDFYEKLQDSKVTIPDLEPIPKRRSRQEGEKAEQAKESRTTTTAVSEARQYLLQAGSFRSSKDAERLRGHLLLQGLSPNIEEVTVGGGETWHRVQLGPFSDQETLNRNRSVLVRNNIDSLLLLMK